jgi:beta-lactamase class A
VTGRARLVVVLLGLVLIPSASGQATPVSSLLRELDELQLTVAGARAGDPEVIEERYERARGLQEMLAGWTSTARCVPLLSALERVAAAHVMATEGFDRLNRTLERQGEATVASAMRTVASTRSHCPRGARLKAKPRPLSLSFVSPLSGEIFFGKVRARCVCSSQPAPVELRWNGRLLERSTVTGATPLIARSLAGRVAPGRGELELRFLNDAGQVQTTTLAEDVWLLPRNANAGAAPEREDRALSRRLATLAAGFAGYAGISVYELTTGRTGGWNEDARFPAASLVKLGLLVAALDRWGNWPESSSVAYDLRAITAWSSNLGANRVLELLGKGSLERGREIVESRLRRMGATRSTYPGDYRVGTSVGTGDGAPHEPPLVSLRTTTARDMSRVLSTLQAAATGSSKARRATGLSAHEAKVALAYLLSSEPRGDNVGLFRPSLPTDTPIAQKHGWISSARHSAAIVYGSNGPVVVVVLTYKEALSLSRSQDLARRVLSAAGLR